MSSKKKLTVEERRAVAQDLVGGENPIRWESDDRGYFLCPMADGHSSPTKDKHTVVYLDNCPTFYCWHESCKKWMEDASYILRKKLDVRTPEEKAEAQLVRDTKTDMHWRAKKLVAAYETIWRDFEWVFPNVHYPLSNFWRLWGPQDVIWIGDVWDTGEERGPGHFAPRERWEQPGAINYNRNQFTCASTFQLGTVDRTVKNVLTTPYVVVEFDSLAKDPIENKRRGAAVLRYLSEKTNLTLKMVVDSGNKSVHGWFLNDLAMDESARFFLRSIGADINTMRPSQPVRLPGGIRDNGNVQKILWMM